MTSRERHNAEQRRYRARQMADPRARAKMAEYQREWQKRKRAADPAYVAMCRLRCVLWKYARRRKTTKGASTAAILGYPPERFAEWAVANGYNPPVNHIDHIVPLSWWLKRYPDNFARAMRGAWNLANLRIIPAAENYAKRARREFLV